MAIEIERKFLVAPERLPLLQNGARYEQGYLAEDPPVRFRIEGRRATLCVKKHLGPGERVELEFPRDGLSDEELTQLRALALWPPLVKTRYRVRHEGLTWEIDVYDGENRGLVTAEVELPERDHPITLPEWLDQDAEITASTTYSNIELTRRPMSRR